MSRRLQSKPVEMLLCLVEDELQKQVPPSWCRWIDAKPLPIGGNSQARDAGYGRAAGGKAKGYKFHAVYDDLQGFVTWQVMPMQIHESKAARQLIGQLEHSGYLGGDNQYDQNALYDLAGQKAIQLLAPRKRNVKGLGHCRHSPSRLRAIEMLTRPFGRGLLQARSQIERAFSQLTSLSFGLSPLPNSVRTLRRVRNWVRGKLIFFNIYRTEITTCVI